MRHLTADITIAATPERVWEVLTDFEAYPEWNPFIVEIAGEPTVGTRLEAKIQPAGKKATRFRPTVTDAKAQTEFAWLGTLGFKGVFDGHHRFELEPTPDGGTRFTQSERFTGILTRPIMAMIGKATEAGFTAMNEALRDRAESR